MAKKTNSKDLQEGPLAAEINPEEQFFVNVDENRVKDLEEKLTNAREEIKSKVYAINMSKAQLENFESYIMNDSSWNSTEALGVLEIWKTITSIKKEGVKNDVVYMKALPLEASHYFLSRTSGKGLEEAKKFIDLYKPFDIALQDAKKDAESIKSMEKELYAAQQGIEMS